MKKIAFIFLAVTIPCLSALAGETFRCRSVGNNWVWFEDHAALYVSYATRGPAGRIYEVGTGISVNGSPWGKRKEYSGDAEFKAYGVGALHIRKRDDGLDFEVCATSSGLRTIPIYRGSF